MKVTNDIELALYRAAEKATSITCLLETTRRMVVEAQGMEDALVMSTDLVRDCKQAVERKFVEVVQQLNDVFTEVERHENRRKTLAELVVVK